MIDIKIPTEYIKLYAIYLVIGACALGTVYMAGAMDSKYQIMDEYDDATMRTLLATTNQECLSDDDCNNGKCELDENAFGESNNSTHCVCDDGYLSVDGEECSYQQRSKLAAFLISLFVGGLGVDWFYLSIGNGCYICAGIGKCLTCGGCGIWWIVDWIRILADTFPDGMGHALYNNM